MRLAPLIVNAPSASCLVVTEFWMCGNEIYLIDCTINTTKENVIVVFKGWWYSVTGGHNKRLGQHFMFIDLFVQIVSLT